MTTKQKLLESVAPVQGPSPDPGGDCSDQPNALIPDPVVWAEFGISSMTGYRWTRDPTLDFPPPIKIRNRCFRSRRLLEAFKARMLRKAIRERHQDEEAANADAS